MSWPWVTLSFIISAKWTVWNWRIYCFHFCVSVCLWALSPDFNSDGGWQASTLCVSQMYLTRAWKFDNISVRTIYRWNLCSLAFWRYSQIQDQNGVLGEVYKNVTVISRKMYCPQHSMQRWRHCHSLLTGALRRKGVIHWSTHQTIWLLPGEARVCDGSIRLSTTLDTWTKIVLIYLLATARLKYTICSIFWCGASSCRSCQSLLSAIYNQL